MGMFRQRMDEELRLRGYSERTRQSYLAQMRRFVAHYRRSPDQLGAEEIRSYLLQMTEVEKLATSTINQALFAIRFFYEKVLGQSWTLDYKCQRRRRKPLREVLSREEVRRMLEVTRNRKHRLMIMVLYSSGLRLSEAVHLELRDIDREGRRIRVRHPKGGRERYVMLSQELLDFLRQYVRQEGIERYLFPNRKASAPVCSNSVQRAVRRAAKLAGIEKAVTPHVLRHTFAAHLVEQGTNLAYIQALMGHKSVKTTMGYLEVAQRGATQVCSPLDVLGAELKG